MKARRLSLPALTIRKRLHIQYECYNIYPKHHQTGLQFRQSDHVSYLGLQTHGPKVPENEMEKKFKMHSFKKNFWPTFFWEKQFLKHKMTHNLVNYGPIFTTEIPKCSEK